MNLKIYTVFFYPCRHNNSNMAEESEEMILRVEVTSDDFRKLVLENKPDNVEELKRRMSNTLELTGEFRLQYFDLAWKQWFSLTSMDDIKDRDSLKVIRTSLIDSDLDDSFVGIGDILDSAGQLGKASASLASTASVDTSIFESDIESSPENLRKSKWPEVFPIPSFSYQTERLLAKGNKDFNKDGTLLPTAGIKKDILEKLAEKIYGYKAYPSNVEIEAVAKALIEKHPCLKEPGSLTGFYGWKQSMKFKMGNYRSKLRGQGCEELDVNASKRKETDEKPAARNVKKPRKAEVNFLPDFPSDESEATLEITRVSLLDEHKKRDNLIAVNEGMEKTFPSRRQEVVLKQPMISTFRTRWPALFTQAQVSKYISSVLCLQ